MRLYMPQFLHRFCFHCLLLFVVVTQPVQSKTEHSSDAIRTAYIFNFLKYIEWPNEAHFDSIDIAYIGKNQGYIQELKRLESQQIRGKDLRVHPNSSLDSSKQYQVVVLDQNQNRKLRDIRRKLYGKQTLLISDSANDKKLIMLNFTSLKGSTIGFELNRYNMVYEKLKPSPDILVLGGTELDIAQLLHDMEQELENTQDHLRQQTGKLESIKSQVAKREQKLSQQANELTKLKSEVAQKENQISDQKKRLASQNKEMTKQSEALKIQTEKLKNKTNDIKKIQSELKELDQALKANRNEVAQSSLELNQKQLEISSKESFIKELSTLINKNKRLLSEQKTHIEDQANAISKQQDDIQIQHKEIESQSSKIQLQSIFLLIGGITLTLVLFLIFIILKSSRASRRANANLATANEELANTNTLLHETQGQLVESEKMAALGNLVAGVAHEINTPLGVSVTAATHLSEHVQSFTKQYRGGSLKRAELESLLEDAEESTSILNRNLERASTLIGNFKQIAADQTVEDIRQFPLAHYLEEISQSLSPQLKKGQHKILIDCDSNIELYSYPGIIAQIFTNLIMNSLIHGFEARTKGKVIISVTQQQDSLHIRYNDDGSGINEEQRGKIFDPFYTTKRSKGGTGLGLHICYNLITQKLKGSITCKPVDSGACFEITIPVSVK